MTRLRREAHARMLGNGLCTRPPELDCRTESACEPAPASVPPVLIRQRDHAQDHGQLERANLFKAASTRSAARPFDKHHPHDADSALGVAGSSHPGQRAPITQFCGDPPPPWR
jgi:hypothetical protein